MKRRLIVAASIFIFLFLIARAFYLHLNGVKMEKLWYVEHLNFEFSGEIDSTRAFQNNIGLIHFHITRGIAEESTESKLNRKLKYNGNLRFMWPEAREGSKTIVTHMVDKCLAGDSLRVNTAADRIEVYRKGQLISESKVSEVINGRPF